MPEMVEPVLSISVIVPPGVAKCTFALVGRSLVSMKFIGRPFKDGSVYKFSLDTG